MQIDRDALQKQLNDPETKRLALNLVGDRVEKGWAMLSLQQLPYDLKMCYHLTAIQLGTELIVMSRAYEALKAENEALKQEVADLMIPDGM